MKCPKCGYDLGRGFTVKGKLELDNRGDLYFIPEEHYGCALLASYNEDGTLERTTHRMENVNKLREVLKIE